MSRDVQTISGERIEFTVPGLAPASWSGNSRAHWRKRHADGDEYAEWVWCAGNPVINRYLVSEVNGVGVGIWLPLSPSATMPWARARLTLVQRAVRPRDVDNFLSSFKPGLDALTTKGKRALGIVLDDTPECLSVEVRTERVSKKADECVLVRVERTLE